MTVDFRTLTSARADEFKKPPVLPAGPYLGMIGVGHKLDEIGKNKTPAVVYPLRLVGPGEGLDPESLKAADGTPIDITKRQFRQTFFLTPDATWRLVEFAKSCGVQTEGRTLGEIIPELEGKDVLVDLIQKPTQDGSDLFNEVAKCVGTANAA